MCDFELLYNGMLYKTVPQYVLFYVWLLPLNVLLVRCIDVVVAHSFSSCIVFCWTNRPHFCCGHLGCFQHGAFMISTSVVTVLWHHLFYKVDCKQSSFSSACFPFYRTRLASGKPFSISLLLLMCLVPFSSRYSAKVKCKAGLSTINMDTETEATNK